MRNTAKDHKVKADTDFLRVSRSEDGDDRNVVLCQWSWTSYQEARPANSPLTLYFGRVARWTVLFAAKYVIIIYVACSMLQDWLELKSILLRLTLIAININRRLILIGDPRISRFTLCDTPPSYPELWVRIWSGVKVFTANFSSIIKIFYRGVPL